MIHKDMIWLLVNRRYGGDINEYCRQMRFPTDAITGWLHNRVQLPNYIKDKMLSSCREYEVGARLVAVDNPIIVTQTMSDKIKRLCARFGDSISDTLSGVVDGGDKDGVGGTIDVDNILLLMQGYDITDNYLLDDTIPIR